MDDRWTLKHNVSCLVDTIRNIKLRGFIQLILKWIIKKKFYFFDLFRHHIFKYITLSYYMLFFKNLTFFFIAIGFHGLHSFPGPFVEVTSITFSSFVTQFSSHVFFSYYIQNMLCDLYVLISSLPPALNLFKLVNIVVFIFAKK